MTELIKKNRLFYTLAVLFWLVCAVVIISYDKGAPSLYVNKFHNLYCDYFFFAITYLGDGLFSVILLVCIALFVNVRQTLVITATFLTVVLVIQALKFTFLEPRPYIYFQDTPGVYYIPWLEMHKFNSFPSGHTAQAFSLALCVCFYWANKYIPWLFVLAMLTGFSRVYLMQHFPIDVAVGSFVAVVITTVAFPLWDKYIPYLQHNQLDRSLISLMKNTKA